MHERDKSEMVSWREHTSSEQVSFSVRFELGHCEGIHDTFADPEVVEHCEQSGAIVIEDEIQKLDGIWPNSGSLDEIH